MNDVEISLEERLEALEQYMNVAAEKFINVVREIMGEK
jgi:hypothetical protein